MGPSARSVPTLSRLADRLVPSATITEVRGVLTVRADADDDTITITDDGSANPGNVTVDTDDATYTAVGAIKQIRVFAGPGDDDVTYMLTNDFAAGAARGVTVRLGQGDDFFTGDVGGSLATGAKLDLSVLAGAGDDTLDLIGGLVDVAAGAQLSLDFHGDGGEDSISASVAGLITGRVRLGIFGGDGDDALDADVTADDGSAGQVFAELRTGAGADMASLYVTAENTISVLAAGANDEVDMTDNVMVV